MPASPPCSADAVVPRATWQAASPSAACTGEEAKDREGSKGNFASGEGLRGERRRLHGVREDSKLTEVSAGPGVPLRCEGFRRGHGALSCGCARQVLTALLTSLQGDSRQPRTMLWSDGMSAAQARKALFGNPVGGGSAGDSLGACHMSVLALP